MVQLNSFLPLTAYFSLVTQYHPLQIWFCWDFFLELIGRIITQTSISESKLVPWSTIDESCLFYSLGLYQYIPLYFTRHTFSHSSLCLEHSSQRPVFQQKLNYFMKFTGALLLSAASFKFVNRSLVSQKSIFALIYFRLKKWERILFCSFDLLV